MAKNCTEVNNLYEDVLHCPGQMSLPGPRSYAYFSSKADIVKWPTLPLQNAKNLAEVAVYEGNFVMAADTVWNRVDLVPNESEVKSEQVGAFGSKHFSNSFTPSIPGTEKDVTGLITMINNDDTVWAVPQRDGQLRIIGNEAFTVEAKPGQDWGKGSGDSNISTIELSVEDMAPAPFYPGELVTSEGIIDGSTGKLKVSETGA